MRHKTVEQTQIFETFLYTGNSDRHSFVHLSTYHSEAGMWDLTGKWLVESHGFQFSMFKVKFHSPYLMEEVPHLSHFGLKAFQLLVNPLVLL